jgi:hypothetical protein
MEIIKRGKIPGDQVMTATCKGCGSELRFRQSEGTELHDPRERGVCVQVECPVCKRAVHGYA